MITTVKPPNRIKEIRTKYALTQEELAQKAGVSAATIAMVERGVNRPQPATLKKIAAALNLSTWDLYE